MRDYTDLAGTTNPLTQETALHATNKAKDSVLSIYGVPHEYMKTRLNPN